MSYAISLSEAIDNLPLRKLAGKDEHSGPDTLTDPEPADGTPTSNEAPKETATLAGFLENHCLAVNVTVELYWFSGNWTKCLSG